MKRHSYNNKQRRHNKNTLMKIITYNFLPLEQPHSQERVGRFWERGCLPCRHTNLNKCHKHGRQHDDVLAIRGQSGHEIPKKKCQTKIGAYHAPTIYHYHWYPSDPIVIKMKTIPYVCHSAED